MRNFSRSLFLITALVVTALALSLSAAFASEVPPPAPEIDPGMLVAGLGAAGGAGALIWERLRRRR